MPYYTMVHSISSLNVLIRRKIAVKGRKKERERGKGRERERMRERENGPVKLGRTLPFLYLFILLSDT